jgi:hypothetical protein
VRHALRDDLPAEAGEQMRRRFGALWQQAAAADDRGEKAAPPAPATWVPPVFPLRRALPAACAVLMLVSGAAMLSGRSSSFLAESFALRQTAASVIGRLERASSMQCRLELRDEPGRILRYAILWVEGSDSRVEMEGAFGRQVTSVPARPSSASLLSRPRSAGNPQRLGGPASEPWVRHIREFLSPSAVAGLMIGNWRPAQGAEVPGLHRAAFTVNESEGPMTALVIIDLDSYLPVSITLYSTGSATRFKSSPPLFNAEFRWERPSGPPGHP